MGLLPLLWYLHLATLENHQEYSEVIGTSLARTVWMLSDFNWKLGPYGLKTHACKKKMGNNINANLACIAWRFWSGMQSNKGGLGL